MASAEASVAGYASWPVASVRRGLWRAETLALALIWILPLVAFSLPGRRAPDSAGSLDSIALIKVAVRGVAIVSLVFALRFWVPATRRRWSLRAMAPFFVFLAWALVSVAWSPLKAVSLGQAGGLASMLLLATLIGAITIEARDVRRLMFHLTALLLVVSSVIAAMHLVAPEQSGMLREDVDEVVSVGIIHPTSAGASSSLGIVVALLGVLAFKIPHGRALLFAGAPIHTFVLLLANSRTAIGMTALAIAVLLVWRHRQWLAAFVLAASMAMVGFLAVDPGLTAAPDVLGGAGGFLSRGQDSTQLRSFTGRTALWRAVGEEFLERPLFGCGYFVTSGNGQLEVWMGPGNHSAHNVGLQVLVSTGVVGLAAWLAGVLTPLARYVAAARRGAGLPALSVALATLGVWYFGWGMLCSSVMGPVESEAVVFFAMFGLMLRGSLPSACDVLKPVASSRGGA